MKALQKPIKKQPRNDLAKDYIFKYNSKSDTESHAVLDDCPSDITHLCLEKNQLNRFSPSCSYRLGLQLLSKVIKRIFFKKGQTDYHQGEKDNNEIQNITFVPIHMVKVRGCYYCYMDSVVTLYIANLLSYLCTVNLLFFEMK